VDLDKARTYLDRACILANLAVKHIDLAVAVISSFVDPKKVATPASLSKRRDAPTSLRYYLHYLAYLLCY
jgi:hypothetical protein